MDTLKTKSAAKLVVPKSEALKNSILKTMRVISNIVGGTLGPGGHPVLIERQEYNLQPLVTKDGVTVFRSLGFQDAVEHAILETVRDASVRTAQEAGDGTTTATILSEAFVRNTLNFCDLHPETPPIRVIKTIQDLFKQEISPAIERLTVKCDFNTSKGKQRLFDVAKLSGNGDADLANAVIECYEITGDEGAVTIVESSGEFGYETVKIEGFPIASGYEKSCAKFYPAFINDPATQRVVLEKPSFLLYFGRLNDFNTVVNILTQIQQAHADNYIDSHDVVLIATGFSDAVLSSLAQIFVKPGNINVFPLIVPETPALNSERHFIDDVAAVTGAEVFDPVTRPLSGAELADLGNVTIEKRMKGGIEIEVYVPLGVKTFEAGRYRSTIVGHCDEDLLLNRIDEVSAGIPKAESEYDSRYLQERVGKLSGGIAQLKVVGSSNGELKERRDRAEDAVCAVRGAIKNGAVVGGGWTLLRIAKELQDAKHNELVTRIVDEIVNPSLLSPLQVLFSNAGFDPTKQDKSVVVSVDVGNPEKAKVTDLSTGECVSAIKAGILDSVPALKQAVANSISSATLLWTLGGVVVWPRDHQAEIVEARDANDFNRMANFNPADERA